MALKTRKERIEAPVTRERRKTKFQADLAPAEDRTLRLLKDELQLTSNTDFLSDAVALFRWAVSERKLGHRIISESASGERKVLLFPRLERVRRTLSFRASRSNGPAANSKVLLISFPRGKRTAPLIP
jgi:hypothetical protein